MVVEPTPPDSQEEQKEAQGLLTLTERFQKAKRNLFWSSGVLIVVAISSPADVKIPGLGDAAVPLHLSLALLFVAFAYFAAEYQALFSVAQVSNSQGGMDAKQKDLQRVYDAQHRKFEELYSKADDFISVYQGYLDDYKEQSEAATTISAELDSRMALVVEKLRFASDAITEKAIQWAVTQMVNDRVGFATNIIQSEYPSLAEDVDVADVLSGALHRAHNLVAPPEHDTILAAIESQRASYVDPAIAEFGKSVVDRFSSTLAEYQRVQTIVRMDDRSLKDLTVHMITTMKAADTAQAALVKKFEKLADSLHSAERFSFTVLDTWVPRAMMALACGATLWAGFLGPQGVLRYHDEADKCVVTGGNPSDPIPTGGNPGKPLATSANPSSGPAHTTH